MVLVVKSDVEVVFHVAWSVLTSLNDVVKRDRGLLLAVGHCDVVY